MASEQTNELDRLRALLDRANLSIADVERVVGGLLAKDIGACSGGCSPGCHTCAPGCSSGGAPKGELGAAVSYPEQLLRALEQALRPLVPKG